MSNRVYAVFGGVAIAALCVASVGARAQVGQGAAYIQCRQLALMAAQQQQLAFGSNAVTAAVAPTLAYRAAEVEFNQCMKTFQQEAMQQQAMQQQVTQQQAYRGAINAEIEAFRTARDHRGRLLHPYYDTVERTMATLASNERRAGHNLLIADLQRFYDSATCFQLRICH